MDITSPELLKNWKTYVIQNKITQPTAKDLFGFLKTAGIPDDLIETSLQKYIDFSKFKKPDQTTNAENKKFSVEQQEAYFNQIIQTLKKMNKAQLQDLIRELNNG